MGSAKNVGHCRRTSSTGRHSLGGRLDAVRPGWIAARTGDLDKFIELELLETRIWSPEVFSSRQARYRKMPLPETMPAFENLVVDDAGWLWAELFRFDKEVPPTWLVFDQAGRGRGSVRMPEGLRVHQIGLDFVLGTWRDRDKVMYVRRHALKRTEGGVAPLRRTPSH